jgi:hypothetical protein
MYRTLMEKSSAVIIHDHPCWYHLSDLISVSQFTLLASTKKGSKPDFHGALGGDQARELYQLFVTKVEQGYAAEKVKDGVFQAMMVQCYHTVPMGSTSTNGQLIARKWLWSTMVRYVASPFHMDDVHK